MGRGRRSPSPEGFSFPSPRFPPYKLMRIAPVLGGSPVGLEGHVEDDPAGTDVCHERGDALPGLLRGGFGDFKQQFVMHLEQQLGVQRAESFVTVDGKHGELDDVRSAALNERVDGLTPGERTRLLAFGLNVRQGTATPASVVT